MSARIRIPRVIGVLAMAALAGTASWAQYPGPPTTYSLTQSNAMMGPGAAQQVTRDGSKVLSDLIYPPGKTFPKGHRSRTVYDLQAHTSHTWDLIDSSAPCGTSTFSGDWGDPLAMSDQLHAQLAQAAAKDLGSENVNGIAARVLEIQDPQSAAKSKVWLEPKYGLVVKAEMTGPDGKTLSLVEVTQLSFTKPNPSVFDVPAACSKAAKPDTAEADRIAAETGGKSDDFLNAITGPASSQSCAVLFRVVRAGSMLPVSSGFQISLNRDVDVEHPGAGGKAQPVTGQLQNGVLRIANVHRMFELDVAWANGASSALIYRQCVKPETVLLLVVKNPDRITEGADWLWVKSGRFAQ